MSGEASLTATHADVAFESTTLYVPRSLRERWVSQRLPREWFESFSGFFREEDLAITRNQNLGHFGEWVAALDYSLHGNEVLIEKYVYKPGTSSHTRAQQVLGEHFAFLRKGRSADGTQRQPPDLLVIPPSGDYFFAEVKYGPDRLRPPQTAWFQEVTRVTGRRIVLVKVRIVEDPRTR